MPWRTATRERGDRQSKLPVAREKRRRNSSHRRTNDHKGQRQRRKLRRRRHTGTNDPAECDERDRPARRDKLGDEQYRQVAIEGARDKLMHGGIVSVLAGYSLPINRRSTYQNIIATDANSSSDAAT